jgi:RNA polymerase sigma-70 factor (ECF subfamily)
VTAIARPLLGQPGSSTVASPAAATGANGFAALYAAHARYIAGVVHRILGGADSEVDDLVQETFIDAIEGIGNLHEPLAARAWLVTVAVRHARRVLGRRRRRAFFAFLAKDYAPRASDPRDRQPVDDLYDALERLPTDLRIPWVLHRIEQLNLPETATACEVSLATVKRRIAEAEQRLEGRFGYVPPSPHGRTRPEQQDGPGSEVSR